MKPMVSVIVPVYNAEQTLRRCVASILEQQFTDLELLLVDDGSTDASGEICDEFAARDARVTVLHQENAGVSAARNHALDQANGTYLQFLDSDDWITPDATRSLVRAAETHHCDLVIADFYRVVGERLSRKGDIDEDGLLTREEYAAHMMENPADFYYGVLWNKLYRRELVERYQLRMDPDISWCEDFLFNLEYIRRADRFYALSVPIYYYVKTRGSLASQSLSISKTVKMKLMIFESYHQFYKDVLDEEGYDRCRAKVYRFLLDAAGDGAVPPLLPTSQKLGDERVRAFQAGVMGSGLLCDAYRARRLLESHLETAALKNGLSLQEAQVLLSLRQLCGPCTRRELADFSCLSRAALALALQRLTSRGLLESEASGYLDVRQPALTSEALPVLADLEAAQEDALADCLAGFTPEERTKYLALSQRITENLKRCLR
ncbi:MAG: glycosyltransferase [Oscillospiraceae bacterium]|nr:glycosyltransferase [Oscillospiraceae bacterium]